MTQPIADSIDTISPAAGPSGQLAHPDAIGHLERLQRKMYRVGEHTWCFVGNGLSNQTFVQGPEGIIAIDTGESVEEMRSALNELRMHTDAPIVACIYTHFHYVAGTTALLDETSGAGLQIYGHAGIAANLERFGGEVAPRSARGMVHQFGIALPDGGDDGLLHCGLGLFYRNPAHAPFTPGHMPAQHLFDEPTTLRIAGLNVRVTPAPSDATDSVTLWFPDLKLCVNNLVWPSLFNIYAIRGEEYRDPRILLNGIDEIYDYQPEHLVCTHGPPLSGDEVGPAILDFRDAIQFIWDQTVRGANKGLTLSELTQAVQLPERFKRTYFTRQFYGLVEHHVRQIHSGLFGWLDEDESHLFPLPDQQRYERLIDGFGGRTNVLVQAQQALQNKDWRWALELATWLVRTPEVDDSDRQILASALRGVAQHTTSTNVRNWCLTRALELEGQLDLSRFRTHRFSAGEVLAAPPTRFIPVLRVLLDPAAAEGLEEELAWHFPGGNRAGLKVRGCVAVATDGADASLSIGLSHETWAQILGAKLKLSDAIEQGLVSIQGPPERIKRFFAAFEHPALS